MREPSAGLSDYQNSRSSRPAHQGTAPSAATVSQSLRNGLIPHQHSDFIRFTSRTEVVLFRAIAGIWDIGEGRIARPKLDNILFLPERPYLPPGTLREILLRTGQKKVINDEQISNVLSKLNSERVLERTGGLDIENDWGGILFIGEQQGLAFARMLLAAPQFAFLDRPHTLLGPSRLDQILSLLSEYSITYITLGGTEDPLERYDRVVQLSEDGGWTWQPLVTGHK